MWKKWLPWAPSCANCPHLGGGSHRINLVTESRVDLGCVGFDESEVWADHALGFGESGVFVDLGDGWKEEYPRRSHLRTAAHCIPDFICMR